MSNANLIALQNAILTNTLSSAQQGALSTALAEIIPLFPNVDEKSIAVPNDESISQTWMSALFALGAGGGSPVVLPVQLLMPPLQTLASFSPGASGKPILVFDVTPQFTGKMIVSVTLGIVSSAAGVPGFAIEVAPDLTAITGGTEIIPGIISEPTSTTPAASVGIFAVEAITFNDGTNPDTSIPIAASIPVQLTVGQRAGIVIVAKDTSTQTWNPISVSASVIELTNG